MCRLPVPRSGGRCTRALRARRPRRRPGGYLRTMARGVLLPGGEARCGGQRGRGTVWRCGGSSRAAPTCLTPTRTSWTRCPSTTLRWYSAPRLRPGCLACCPAALARPMTGRAAGHSQSGAPPVGRACLFLRADRPLTGVPVAGRTRGRDRPPGAGQRVAHVHQPVESHASPHGGVRWAHRGDPSLGRQSPRATRQGCLRAPANPPASPLLR